MLQSIMRFLDRTDELARLESLVAASGGGLAVVYGRRRIGKTRLLMEWCHRHGGIYAVADQSTAEIQRRYFAEALARRFAGFADVQYPDWSALLTRLARDARAEGWRGPLVLDELPYWVGSSPELPTVLQRWIDHEAKAAALVVAVAGSSQRMMQGLALAGDSPLYGRARELFEVMPLDLPYVADAIGTTSSRHVLDFYAAWGGVPRYWELAHDYTEVRRAIDDLVLDPRGPLHREPDRLLLEEMPSALEVRPVLDAIGGGAHRVSEIAARMGRPATSLARPLERLVELGLAKREVPFGESEKRSRRSLYRISDPFTRLWFRVVAPHRAELVSGTRETRLSVLGNHWDHLVAAAWEDTCRARLPKLSKGSQVGRLGPWKPGARWWHGNAPEWDLVAENTAGTHLLLGEAKRSTRPMALSGVRRELAALAARPPPALPGEYQRHRIVHALFIPDIATSGEIGELPVVSLGDLAHER
jgi:uncharacterized protein